MKIIDKESRKGKILRSIHIGLAFSVAMTNKRHSFRLTSELIKIIFGKKKPKDIGRDIWRLRKQNLIDIVDKNGKQKIVLTEEGRKIILRFDYEDLKIKESKIWDQKWRMVLFDIPTKYKKSRDAFSFKMRHMGFVRFNNSVWVYPYSCQKEIDFIANFWGIGKYVHFALVSKITNEQELLKHFDL